MKTYDYKGYTFAGATRKGMIEAMHPKAAREQLARHGILVERLSVSGARVRRVTSEMRAMLYRELAALLAAGMPLVSALDTLIATPEMRGVEGVLGAIRDQVREGGALATALSESRASLSTFETATIDVAERAASLETVLVQLADFIEEQDRTRARIQQALIYPALVLGLGICVAIVMLGFLVPRTRELMGSVTGTLPVLTRVMLTVGNVVWPWGGVVLMALFGACLAWGRHVHRTPRLRIQHDRWRFRLPLWGRGYTLLTAIRFSRTLAILVRAGVPLVEGVPLAARATGSAWVLALADTEGERLRHGATLAETLRGIPPLAGLLSGWVAVGEASGNLAELLERAATRCQTHWERFLNRALTLMEPVLLLIVGGFVLLITLSVLLPVFSLSSAVAR